MLLDKQTSELRPPRLLLGRQPRGNISLADSLWISNSFKRHYQAQAAP